MARYVNCKKGQHDYADAGHVGGGIARRTCGMCGFVQIDLSEALPVNDSGLFTEPKLASMFRVEALLAQVDDEPVRAPQSFGERPLQRRRAARVFG